MNLEDARPEGANDPSVSSRAKDALFGEPVRDKTGRFASKTEAVFQEPTPSDVPPERHESGSYEQDQSDATEEDADFETEEFYGGE